jgi:AMMECR1 domain-containing protein
MQEGGRRGTFLPSVWESLTEPSDFLQHLKQKSGLHKQAKLAIMENSQFIATK